MRIAVSGPATKAAVKRLKRWLHLGHRWLGIATGLLILLWFGSGLVMLCVGFPTLTEGERLGALPPLALAGVRITPQAAVERAGLAHFPTRLTLAMRGGEPAYWITDTDGRRQALSAATGDPVPRLTAERATALAATHPAARAVTDRGTVTRDQWTVTARYDPLRPFRVVALGDPAGTELYLSAATGELALDTTRTERVWNWPGAVTHWIYLTPLRARAGLWQDVVLWVSGIALAGALSGYVLGFVRLMRDRLTPYRGWAAWHHLAGVAGGLVVVTFLLSGWLSMNPRGWFGPRSPDAAMRAAYAGQTAPIFPLGLDALARAPAGTVALDFAWIGGRPVILASGPGGTAPCCGTALPPRRSLPPPGRCCRGRGCDRSPGSRHRTRTGTTATARPRCRSCASPSTIRPAPGSTSIPPPGRSWDGPIAAAGPTAGCSMPSIPSMPARWPGTRPCASH